MFYDSEFSSWDEPNLISVGFTTVGRHSQTLYVELADTYSEIDCSAFVRSQVIPKLRGGDYLVSSITARERISLWIQALGGPVCLVCDYPEYDHELLRRLLAAAWPQFLAREPLSFDPSGLGHRRALTNTLGRVVDDHVQRYGMHHALVDAERLAATWSALLQLGRDPGRSGWTNGARSRGRSAMEWFRVTGGPIFRRRSQAMGAQRQPAACYLEASKVTNAPGG